MNSKPGKHLEALVDGAIVLRFVISQDTDTVIDASAFELSSEEKIKGPHRISVWEKSLTPVSVAKEFVSNPKRDLVVELNVGEIRSLVDNITNENFGLDVLWDHLEDCINQEEGQRYPDAKNGCEGHCGIFGIYPNNKTVRKRLRATLTELANKSNFYKV